ncbi:unnamed protein product [Boreogadus saida]
MALWNRLRCVHVYVHAFILDAKVGDMSPMIEKNWGERNFGLDSLKAMNRDMEEKGIALRELSCRTAAKLPAPDLPASAAVVFWSTLAGAAGKLRPQSGGDSSVAFRQLSSGSTIPFFSMSPPADCCRSFGGNPAAPMGGAWRQSGRERDCTPGAARPLVHKI